MAGNVDSKLTLMFKEVCGHLITLTTDLVVLPYCIALFVSAWF